MNYRDEIDRQLTFERGATVDVAIRFGGVSLGSVLLYLYTGYPIAFLWSGGYVATYLLYRWYLQMLGEHVSLRQQVTSHSLMIALTVAFLWMPSLMLVQGDPDQSLVGAALVGSQLVYLVRRGDTALFLVIGMTIANVVLFSAVVAYTVSGLDNIVAIAGVTLSWLALFFYLTQSLFVARARILSENKAKAESFQAQKLSALGQFAGGVAHDFNNILTAISGNLELFKELEDADEKKAAIDAAHQASQRAAKIVRQILIFSRKSPIELKNVDANAPVSSMLVLMQHLIPPRIKFSVNPLPVQKCVKIDQDQFVTGLLNLVLNSVDAIESIGRIDLSLSVERRRKKMSMAGGRILGDGEYVVYRVSDTGSGIPERIVKSVVEPFFSTKPVGKGTGLGLSMVVSIAESVGGGLEIETSSEGTTMRVLVPLVVMPDPISV